ncbi:MAG: hypothetical protein ACE5GW_05285, partial [Planctomycetota bacterium]
RGLAFQLRRQGRMFHSVAVQTDGIARVRGQDPGDYRLQLMVAGFPPSEEVDVGLIEGEVTRVELTLDGSTPAVAVRVLDSAGEPLGGARVSIARSGPAGLEWGGMENGTTDPTGVFHSNTIRGEGIVIRVSAPAHAPATLEDAASQVSSGELTIRLDPESAFLVSVRDAGGAPVDGVAVDCRPASRGGSVSRMPSLSLDFNRPETRDGVVRVGELEAGPYRLRFLRGRETLGHLEAEVAYSEEREVEFTVEAGFTVTGTVRVNGAPVESGTLRIQGETSRTRLSAGVGRDGGFSVELRGAESYRFTYQRDDGPRRGLTVVRRVEGAGSMMIDFETVTLSGLVLGSDGEPVGGISGFLSGEDWLQFTTDAGGRFTVGDAALGTYRWSFREPPSGAFAPAVSFDLVAATEVTYSFQPGARIEIQVGVVGGGAPGRIRVVHMSEDGVRTTLNRGDGENAFIWPRGAGSGYVSASGHAPAFFEIDDPEAEPTVTVSLVPGGSLRISIDGENERPLGNHPFRVEPLGDASLHELYREQETSSRGTRHLTLAPGSYRVLTTLPSGEEVESEAAVVAGESVELRLP